MRKPQRQIWQVMLLCLLIGMAGACKNKKKVSEITDTQEVKDQMAEELGEDEKVVSETQDEPERKPTKAPSKSQKLTQSFSAINDAASTSEANDKIQETLGMFSSPDVPVLIIIYQKGDTTDYDEPTTIERYLNYLKDTKQGFAQVEEMVLDDNGKIKELVLRK